jgi:hypothetical protein
MLLHVVLLGDAGWERMHSGSSNTHHAILKQLIALRTAPIRYLSAYPVVLIIHNIAAERICCGGPHTILLLHSPC